MKRYLNLMIICFVLLLSSCSSIDKEELHNLAYERATIENFLERDDGIHLRIHNILLDTSENNDNYDVVDEDDTIYDFIQTMNYNETSYSRKTDSSIEFGYYGRSKSTYLYLYSEDRIIEVCNTIDGHLDIVFCSRYYQISDEDCNYIMECIEALKTK